MEFPPRCQDSCPLDEVESNDLKYGCALRRNCPGVEIITVISERDDPYFRGLAELGVETPDTWTAKCGNPGADEFFKLQTNGKLKGEADG